jgi:hypothetical protein
MTWLWTVLVFALPLVFVGETLLLRVREGKPVRYGPTIAITAGVMVVAGFVLSATRLVRFVPQLPFDLPNDACGAELAAMLVPGLVVVIAASRRGNDPRSRRGAWLAVLLAIAATTAIGIVASSPHHTPRGFWISAASAAVILVAWTANELVGRRARAPMLPEARLGDSTRGPRPLAFVGIVVAATVVLFGGLRVMPRVLLHTSAADFVPVLHVAADDAFASDGRAIAYVEDRDLVLRLDDATTRVPLDPSGCWRGRFMSFPKLYIYPDHTHVLLLASGSAACFATFGVNPQVTSLRELFASEYFLDTPDNAIIEIAGPSPEHTVVYADGMLVALDVVARKLAALDDDRAHVATTQCTLGATTSELRLACSRMQIDNGGAIADRFDVERFGATSWPPTRRTTTQLHPMTSTNASMRFSPDGTLLARWDRTTGAIEVLDVDSDAVTRITKPRSGQIGSVSFLDDAHLLVTRDNPFPGVHPGTLDTMPLVPPGDIVSRSIPYGGKPFVVGSQLWIVGPLADVFMLPL